MASDWYALVVPERILWPFIACASKQLDKQSVQLADTASPYQPQKAFVPLPTLDKLLLISGPATVRRLSCLEYNIACSGPGERRTSEVQSKR